MKTMLPIRSASLALALAAALPAFAQETVPAASPAPALPATSFADEGFYEDFIQDRLTIGVRVSTFRLKDASRPADPERVKTFVGFVNELKEEDDVHVYPTIAWWICPYVSVEATYDEVEASTWNFNNHATDGNIKMGGPIFSIRGQYPFFENRLIPYVGIGYAIWSADFEESPSWFTRSNGSHRVMDCKDDNGVALTVGVAYRPIRHLEIELMARSLDVTSEAEFYYLYGRGKREFRRGGEFTLEHVAYGLAASYVF